MGRHKIFDPDEVIDKSIDIFLVKGYDATVIKDIVEATNVHPGSLYNAFGNKRQIYRRALERFIGLSRFNETLAKAETAPPRKTIETLFDDLIEEGEHRGAAGHCLVSNAAMELGGTDHEITEWLRGVFQESENLLCRLIERGQTNGEIKSQRPARELAQFLANTVQGLQLMARFETDRSKLRKVADIALDALDHPVTRQNKARRI